MREMPASCWIGSTQGTLRDSLAASPCAGCHSLNFLEHIITFLNKLRFLSIYWTEVTPINAEHYHGILSCKRWACLCKALKLRARACANDRSPLVSYSLHERLKTTAIGVGFVLIKQLRKPWRLIE